MVVQVEPTPEQREQQTQAVVVEVDALQAQAGQAAPA